MGDPTKRKKTLKFLALSAVVGAIAVLITSFSVNPFIESQPRNACINDIETNYKISFTVELFVDGLKADIPANIGFMEGGCQRTIYTLSDDGTVFVEWKEDPGFEFGHFLWIADFPLREMVESKSTLYVNGKEAEHFIKYPLEDGYHYKAEFTSKEHEASEDTDFLPPDV